MSRAQRGDHERAVSDAGPAAAERSEKADVDWVDGDEHIQRIRRLGRQLFEVANCLVTFRQAGPDVPGRSLDAIESAFCRDVSLSDLPVVVPDTREHLSLRQQRAVMEAPYIRFFASHPIYDQEREIVGAINLIAYSPRSPFRDEELQTLADLAALVERELQYRMMNVSQLDLQKKNKNLRRKSLIDPLIGTWNRGAIMRILSIEAARCQKAKVPLSLIVADLDYFKKINDTHGHPAGDKVLVKVASRLRSCIRPQEALGRYGGEEFLVVLPGSSHQTAMAVAERMRRAVASEAENIGTATLTLTISAGVASTDMFPAAGTEELISRADVALYAAKDAGRNCVVNAIPAATDRLTE